MSISTIKQILEQHKDPVQIEVMSQKTGTNAGGKIWAQASTFSEGVFTVFGAENPVPGRELAFKQASNPRQISAMERMRRQDKKQRDGYVSLGFYYLEVKNGKVMALNEPSQSPQSQPTSEPAAPQGRLPRTLTVGGDDHAPAGVDWFF